MEDDIWEAEGHWSLPESPEHEVFGRATFEPGGQWELAIHGSIEPPPEKAPGSVSLLTAVETEIPMICGRATSGRSVSLHDCRGISLPWLAGGASGGETWRFQSIVLGHDHVTPSEPVESVDVRLGPLLEWSGRRGPELTIGEEDDVFISTSTVHVGTATLDVATIDFVLAQSWSRGRRSATINHLARFRCTPAVPMDIDEALRRLVVPLRDLIAFLALGHASVDDINAALKRDPEDARRQRRYRYHTRFQVPHRPDPARRRHEMLLPWPIPEMSIHDLLEAWFALCAKHPKALTLLLLPHHATYLYTDDYLLTGFNAVEAYHAVAIGGTAIPPEEHTERVNAIVAGAPPEHRNWAENILRGKNEPGLRRKLKDVLARAGTTGSTVVEAFPEFVDRSLAARHKVAHASTTAEHDGLVFLACATGLRWLLRHCFLVDLGLGEDFVSETIDNGSAFSNDMANLRQWSTHL